LASGPSTFHREPAPLLGEHNREVLGALGVTEDELVALEADGVIGTAPALGGRRKAAR
jgi:crotonobetainyl-CoA:carnitine CoA-transferase CaiB-like acyl-CoA transferase